MRGSALISVLLAGESGEITETVKVGPVELVRGRPWQNLGPLADACTRGGMSATALSYGRIPEGLERPNIWLLSDLPFAAADVFGILDRLTADVPERSGLVMIGGAFSFVGLDRLGGWQDPRGAALLPVALADAADAAEAPAGVQIVPTRGCPAELRRVLAEAPPFLGYNRLQPKTTALVLANFNDGSPALVISKSAPRRSVAFASDLLPHWAPTAAAWEGLPALLRGLCELAMGHSV